MKCPKCGNTDAPRHMHDEAHGLSGTHMAGSERFECRGCGHVLSREEAKAVGLKYVLDKGD
jgi:predicted RNA-binding Zn-ribbon protein involved in translation (DUF1610 family)